MRMCLRVADRLIYTLRKVAQLNFKRMAMLLTRRIQGASIKKKMVPTPSLSFCLRAITFFAAEIEGVTPRSSRRSSNKNAKLSAVALVIQVAER